MSNKTVNKIYLLVLILFASCKPKEKEAERKIHDRLISFKDSTIMDMDELVSMMSSDTNFIKKVYAENFNEQTDMIEYRNGEISISYLSIVNGCAEYGGNLEFNKDTIFLKLDNLNDIVCTEQRCDRLIYKISNPENKKYIIKKY